MTNLLKKSILSIDIACLSFFFLFLSASMLYFHKNVDIITKRVITLTSQLNIDEIRKDCIKTIYIEGTNIINKQYIFNKPGNVAISIGHANNHKLKALLIRYTDTCKQ